MRATIGVMTLGVVVLLSTSGLADIVLTIDVAVDKAVYTVGESVNWTLSVSATDDMPPVDNVGIAGVSVDLSDSTGEAISAGTIDVAWPNASYSLSTGGTPAGADLEDVNSGVCLPALGFCTSPLGGTGATHALATGNFTANILGAHTLTGTSNAIDSQFFANNLMTVQPFDQLNSGSADFTVVPEPSGWILVSILPLFLLLSNLKRLSKLLCQRR